MAVAVAVMGLVILRLTEATAPMRRVLWPVLFGAIVALLLFAFNVLSFTLATSTALTGALGWVLSLARAAVQLGFLVGLLRMRMDKAAVATLVVGLQDERRRGSLERSIADALHDRAAKLGYWSRAARTYLDRIGKVLTLPPPGSGLSVTFVDRADEPLGSSSISMMRCSTTTRRSSTRYRPPSRWRSTVTAWPRPCTLRPRPPGSCRADR